VTVSISIWPVLSPLAWEGPPLVIRPRYHPPAFVLFCFFTTLSPRGFDNPTFGVFLAPFFGPPFPDLLQPVLGAFLHPPLYPTSIIFPPPDSPPEFFLFEKSVRTPPAATCQYLLFFVYEVSRPLLFSVCSPNQFLPDVPFTVGTIVVRHTPTPGS